MLLLASAVLSAVVGQMDDALSIAAAVLIVSTVGTSCLASLYVLAADGCECIMDSFCARV
jgi:hypothetical protein